MAGFDWGMDMRNSWITAFSLLLLILSGCTVSFSPQPQADLPEPTAGSPLQQAEAEAAAREYLSMIDSAAYDETWERSGSALRDTSSRFVWTNMLKATSRSLGIDADRQVDGFGFTTQPDAGVPVGEYVLVQFKSQSGNATATEKIVMQREQGAWKIVGYFITKRAEFGTEA